MKYVLRVKFFFLSIFCFFLANGQEYKFEHLGRNQGLSNTFIYSIDQDENGLLIVGTSEGVAVYDGKAFQMFNSENGLSEDFVSSSYKDSKGNIWFGHKKGGASKYSNKEFQKIHPGHGINSIVNSIVEDERNKIWFATQNKGIYYIDQNGEFQFFLDDFYGDLIQSICFFNDGRMFIGTDKGLDVYDYYEDEESIYKVMEIQELSDLSVVDLVEDDQGNLIIATKQSGIYQLEKSKSVYSCKKINISNFNPNIIIKDLYLTNNMLFVSSIKQGVLKIAINGEYKIIEKYNQFSGLKTNAVNTSLIDREGVLWVGTVGEGIASKANNYFTFFFRDKVIPKKYSYLLVNDVHLYVASEGELIQYSKHDFNEINKWGVSNGLPENEITCFAFNSDSTLFVGTEEKGLYYKVNNESQFKKIKLSSDLLSNSIRSICSLKGKLWAGTLNGVFKVDEKSLGITSYNISTGLSHNSVGYIYKHKEVVYVGTKSAFLSEFHAEDIRNFQLSDQLTLVNINMIKADDYDNLWISSKDNGLFVITGDSTQEAGMSFVLQYNASDGLLSNYCYGVSIDNKNNTWVTHDGGVSKFDKERGEFKYYNEQDGLNISFSESAISNWGNELWFGTDNGIVRYNADEEFINKIPPITSIKKIKINDQLKNVTDQISLPFGEYDVEFLFNGLSLRKSDEVTYEFRLIGYEEKWSDKLTQNSTKYPKLSDGEYVFQVRSYNSDGIMGDVVEFKIFIEIPFWKKWWFYLSIFILVILLVTLVIKLRERNLIKYQKTLENQLALRTKEVVNQKEKIEEINKDLTDSINYAKRIQIQVLPEKEHFDSILPSSFVLYKPKDIVSGDFFWIKEIGDEIILVCADCTGHGVPGGFMSMIGSILIHEAIVFHKKLDPADILKEIDVNIKTVLHQKDDYESNKDGMDLAIITINRKTGKLKFSGAMRPCHIYRNGSINILSGDRYSIGGFALANKEYTTKEFQLKKGDFIYLFSDGYADQFGGEKVRKLKMSGFNELLDQLASAPMDDQYKIASNFLKNWMGDNSQMDDILLMGLEYL